MGKWQIGSIGYRNTLEKTVCVTTGLFRAQTKTSEKQQRKINKEIIKIFTQDLMQSIKQKEQ